jgi:chaperonin GroES
MIGKFRPNGDRILIKRALHEETTASGIIIPDNAKEKAQTGSVVAIGSGKLDANGNRITPAVKVGDTVYFGKYSGTEMDDDHLIIREEEILGFIEQ